MITYDNKSQLPIKERTFRFAVNIVRFCNRLKELRQYEISNQLIRSGTSIGANLREASNGYTKKDFVYKVSIAQKEADETIYWLEILNEVLNEQEIGPLKNEATQILKIIKTIKMNSIKKL